MELNTSITFLQILCEEKRFLPHHESLQTVITDRNLIKAPNPPILIPFGSFIFSSVLIYWAGVPILNHFPCLVQIWTKFRILDLIEATVECGNIYFWRFWYNFCCWKILVWPPSISTAFPRIRVRESRWNRCLVATLLSLSWTQHPGLFSAQLLLPL